MLGTAPPPVTPGRQKWIPLFVQSRTSFVKPLIFLTLALALCIFMFRTPAKSLSPKSKTTSGLAQGTSSVQSPLKSSVVPSKPKSDASPKTPVEPAPKPVAKKTPSANSKTASKPSTVSPPRSKAVQNTLASKLYKKERPWNGDRPRWCDDLIAHPLEPSKKHSFYGCKRDRFGAICADGRPRFFSSANQDIWTWLQHWRYLKRPGVYLDIAANEPVRTSNTYFYDVCMKWRGLCVEANPKYHALLGKLRSCGIMPTCLSDREEKVSFLMDEALSGISATNKNRKMKKDRAISMTCVPTSQAVDAFGVHDVDMLSLDVEGHEEKVLKGIDWKKLRINVVLIETVSKGSAAILARQGFRKMNVRGGYGKVNVIWHDKVYVHRRVVWGKPV